MNIPIRSYHGLLVVRLAALGLLPWFASGVGAQPPGGGGPARPLPVVVAPVVLEASFGDTLEALGTTMANESVEITANVNEFVREIRFEEGQRVKAGDILVVLDHAEEDAALKAARALLAERTASFKRAQELVQQQAVSTATLEERQALLSQIEGTIEGIEAQIRDRVIRAPFDGILGLRQVSVGALVRPGDIITTIDDLDRVKVDFEAPSLFLAALRPGLAFKGQVDAYGNAAFTGTISTIDSRIDTVTRTITVRGVLPNDDGRLLAGLLMHIEVTKNPRPALLIPESAIIQRGTESFVFAVTERDGSTIAEQRPVTTGHRSPGRVEIVSGLQEGDQVIVHGLMQVRPGQPVTVRGVQEGDEPLTSFTGDTLRSNGGQ